MCCARSLHKQDGNAPEIVSSLVGMQAQRKAREAEVVAAQPEARHADAIDMGHPAEVAAAHADDPMGEPASNGEAQDVSRHNANTSNAISEIPPPDANGKEPPIDEQNSQGSLHPALVRQMWRY